MKIGRFGSVRFSGCPGPNRSVRGGFAGNRSRPKKTMDRSVRGGSVFFDFFGFFGPALRLRWTARICYFWGVKIVFFGFSVQIGVVSG